ncbi:MAG: hypothetical protein E5X67_10105 [Mesorhizobium sp.]|uniref:recombinase family protein n=1 Tax=Mesorhizobium sp. TaxID=1871066 RepID=UPI001202D3C5|nr:recombinase family protein [Mesorhizobium sp.]TIP28765.1 MAG: hypothetical protein E5X67_10105 [Mesorhizobium sp.]
MPFGRGNLYHLLSKPIYVGKIRHKDQVYEGEREPIVTSATFEAAQAPLASQALRRRSQSKVTQPHLLTVCSSMKPARNCDRTRSALEFAGRLRMAAYGRNSRFNTRWTGK